eukprot:XP_028343918.1 vicilin-like seed storage protein At2g18540 [Physeter catodon]
MLASEAQELEGFQLRGWRFFLEVLRSCSRVTRQVGSAEHGDSATFELPTFYVHGNVLSSSRLQSWILKRRAAQNVPLETLSKSQREDEETRKAQRNLHLFTEANVAQTSISRKQKQTTATTLAGRPVLLDLGPLAYNSRKVVALLVGEEVSDEAAGSDGNDDNAKCETEKGERRVQMGFADRDGIDETGLLREGSCEAMSELSKKPRNVEENISCREHECGIYQNRAAVEALEKAEETSRQKLRELRDKHCFELLNGLQEVMKSTVEAGQGDAEAQGELKPEGLRQKFVAFQKRPDCPVQSTREAEVEQGYEGSLRQKEQELETTMKQKKEKIERTIAEEESALRRHVEERDKRRRRRAELEICKFVEKNNSDAKHRLTQESASGLLERFDEEQNQFLAALTAERQRQSNLVETLKKAKTKARRLKERKSRDSERLRFLAKQKELTQNCENLQRKKLIANQMSKKAKLDREEEERRRGERLLALQREENAHVRRKSTLRVHCSAFKNTDSVGSSGCSARRFAHNFPEKPENANMASRSHPSAHQRRLRACRSLDVYAFGRHKSA